MARNRGYNNYRGRRSKGKAALAVLLVLVILAAAAVLLLQRHIVYDETGTPRLEVPWVQDTEEDAEPEPELDLVVQAPRVPELHGFCLPADGAQWTDALAAHPDCDAAVAVLKDGTGAVYAALPSAVSGSVDVTEEMEAVLAELTGGTLRSIAKLSCLRDPLAAAADPAGLGLEDIGGYPFYDGENQPWLDPAKSAVRQYLCALAVEAAELGFDELLLTDLTYPTDGRLERIAADDAEQREALKLLLEELRAALEPYGTLIAVEVSPEVVKADGQENAGLPLTDLAAAADRVVCAAASAEEATALREAVGDTISFTALLTTQDPAWNGSWLLAD